MKVKKTIALSLFLLACYLPCILMLSHGETSRTVEAKQHNNTIYYVKAELYGIDQNGVMTLLDEQGNLWEVEGLDLREGEPLVLMIDNNNTVVRKTDDVIIGVYLLAEPVTQEVEAQE